MLDRRLIGKQYPPTINEIERGAIRRFATVLGDMHPAHHDSASALAAGFSGLLAPPTFAASLETSFDPARELGIEPRNLAIAEQSFEFHAPICAGDTVAVGTRVVDLYERQVPGSVWEFIVLEDEGRDPKGNLLFRMRRTFAVRPSRPVTKT